MEIDDYLLHDLFPLSFGGQKKVAKKTQSLVKMFLCACARKAKNRKLPRNTDVCGVKHAIFYALLTCRMTKHFQGDNLDLS